MNLGRPLKKHILFAICVSVFAITAGCIHRPPPNTNDDDGTIAKATALIDSGKYEDATQLLNDFLNASPNDTRARLLLSNAYVRWSGIKFNDFVPLARFYLNQSEKKTGIPAGNDSLLKALRHSPHLGNSNLVKSVDEFERLLLSLDAYTIAFNLIPELTESQYVRFTEGLNEAVLADCTKKGDILYRVVLRIIDLKFIWTHRDLLNFMDAQCKIVPDQFFSFANTTRADYLTISTELTTVYPNLGDELSRSIAQFDAISSEVEKKFESAFGSSTIVSSFGRGITAAKKAPEHRSIWDCIQ